MWDTPLGHSVTSKVERKEGMKGSGGVMVARVLNTHNRVAGN